MAKVKGAALAALPFAVLLALMPLAGCDRSTPTPGDTVLADKPPPPAPAAPTETLEAATAACKEETRAKGIKSMVAIFQRLRPGQADKDFAECMKGRGYGVTQ